jgi:gluconolactonase
VLVKDFEGKKLNGPNDLWVDPKGGIYFTDPFYKRDYWTRTEKEIEKENVYYLSPDGKTLKVAATDFVRPNGIVGSADGKTLYVADINARKTYSFKINDDASLTDRKLFAEMGSDGMTIDNKGNVYLTGKGVTVFDSSGKQIDHINIDEPWTANVCFGGKGQKTLFVTASKSVYTLKMKVKGVR